MAVVEQIIPATPQVIGGGRILPSPSQFFLTGEDRLRVYSSSSLAGVAVKVQWRSADPTGVIVPSSQTHTPNSDRTIKTEDYELGSGSLLNVTVFASAGAPRVGHTYVGVQLVRGRGAAAIVLGTLLGGCVTATQALGFPGSPILTSLDAGYLLRSISGTLPAAGAEFIETVPTGARWEVITVVTSLQASGVAATRGAKLVFAGGVNPIGLCPQILGVTAGQFVPLAWMVGMENDAGVGGLMGWQGIPAGMFLSGGDHFNSSTLNIQAGDQYNQPTYSVKEWLEV